MKQQRTGSIINIASMAAITGLDRRVYTDGMPAQAIDYASPKAAIVGLTRDLAAYLGPDGIPVNAISPADLNVTSVNHLLNPIRIKRLYEDGLRLDRCKGSHSFFSCFTMKLLTGEKILIFILTV